LFCWLFARRYGGQFILRIDDTDQQRNVDEALQPILDGLRWLGIDWDEGPQVGGPYAPYYQSQRLPFYQAAVEKLLAAGHAYRDYATTEEIQAEREAAEREKRPFIYSRRWMAQTPAQQAEFEAQGRKSVVRLNMPHEGTLVLEDLVRGRVEFEWAREQDHVIQRADGSCLYHLANVVDDYEFGITHVIRAEEHLSNTPRQVFIVQGLGYPLPQYAHLPFVAEPGSHNKLSKRKLDKYLKNHDFAELMQHGRKIAEGMKLETSPDTFNPVVVDFYREIGFLPEAITNYLALLGWSLDDKREDFTRQELVENFSLERVNKAPASFDPKKLTAFQDRHMQRRSLDERVALTTPFLQQAGALSDPPSADQQTKVRQVVEAAADRIKLAGDVLEYLTFFTDSDHLDYDEKAFEKYVRKPGAGELLREVKDLLAQAESFEPPALEESVRKFVETKGIKFGDIIHALRIAVTGRSIGFGLYEALSILGRRQCIERIDRTLER
jgi:glutamyl-tRNA synthetase